ncbi:hypothetical protein GCM10007036_20710 [Alsobacter metallidurans]|uniref:Heparinase II/III-like protein n=1 Tax=Alsobacter metallidurans TaxID=340221 RepID=A0A917I6M5_9HYPH|nr:heparinase II/III-family protein [Alsobacter metallidurans]GGH18477.1 hypothetical protein GCM10007036_20710 [Alsobacter metallidurans]
MTLDRFRWYAQRLRAMSPAEVLHRFGEQWKRARSRGYAAGWDGFDRQDGVLAFLPIFTRLRGGWPEPLPSRMQTAAAAARDGRLSLLGQMWPPTRFEPAIWAIDPVSGAPWSSPSTYCFDVDFRHAKGRGDVKFAFELSRLQALHPVAALAIQKRDPEAAAFCLGVLRSWMDGNPPFQGVNWYSGIELALRLVSVALVVAAAGEALSPEDRRRIRALVAAHGFWLARFPSRFSSANNHLVAEGLGLLVAALLAPDLAEAPHWRAEGRGILVDATGSQFHADGWGAEQSPTYTAFTLEMLALGATLLADAGDPLPPECIVRLRRAGDALRHALDHDGHAPHIGDDDEGRVLACPPDREPRYAASVLAGLAGVLDAPELSPPERDPHWRDLLFGSPPAGGAAPDGVQVFPHGGMTFASGAAAGRRTMLAFDHGPLGFLSIAAHGHADALALWLHIDGRPVIVDSGTYLYSGGGEVRAWLRSSAAHSTLVIDGRSQSLVSGAFNWRMKTDANLDERLPGDVWRIRASHGGYEKRFGFRHERQIEPDDDGHLVTDRLIGSGPDRPVAIRFHIHPALRIEIKADHAVVHDDGGPLLAIRPAAPVRIALEAGTVADPPWFSPAFNALEGGQAVVIHTTTAALRQPLRTQLRVLPVS